MLLAVVRPSKPRAVNRTEPRFGGSCSICIASLHQCCESMLRVGQRFVPPRVRATGLARQTLEPPEGHEAGFAAILTGELFIAQHVASAPERKGRRGLLATRTNQREVPCTQAQHE